MDRPKCDVCSDTGWYGDNGPGIRGNAEYNPCDQCERGLETETVVLNARGLNALREDLRLAHAAREAAEQRALAAEARIAAVYDALDCEEINPSNYDHDLVCAMNNAVINAWRIIESSPAPLAVVEGPVCPCGYHHSICCAMCPECKTHESKFINCMIITVPKEAPHDQAD